MTSVFINKGCLDTLRHTGERVSCEREGRDQDSQHQALAGQWGQRQTPTKEDECEWLLSEGGV